MGIADALTAVNWLAVLAATAAAFALGAMWYSKFLFGTAWMQEVGLSDESVAKINMRPVLAGTAMLQFVAATALAAFLGAGRFSVGGARGRFKPILRRSSHITVILRERGA